MTSTSSPKFARVAILMPTHGEPISALRLTLQSCCAQSYPNYAVIACDDTNRPEVRQLAIDLGCQYVGESNRNRNKAGNLNNAWPHLADTEFIAVCDAGDVLYPEFLSSLVPILAEHAGYAFVQGLSEPGNPDKLQAALGLHFFPAPSKKRRKFIGSLFGDEYVGSHGSGFLIRRAAVEELGGFPWKCLSDDTYLSLLLYERGWKSVRSSEVVITAPNPGGLVNMVEQQIRWMIGVLQILALRPNPLLSTKFPLRARLRILLPHLAKVYESMVIVAVLLPLFFLFQSGSPPVLQFGLVGAIVVAISAQFACALCRRRTFMWEALYTAMTAWPAARALVRFVRDPWGQPFRVTDKSSASGLDGKAAKALMQPLCAYLFVYLAGIVFHFSRLENGWNQHLACSIALFAWAVYNMAVFTYSIAIVWHSTRCAITESMSEASL